MLLLMKWIMMILPQNPKLLAWSPGAGDDVDVVDLIVTEDGGRRGEDHHYMMTMNKRINKMTGWILEEIQATLTKETKEEQVVELEEESEGVSEVREEQEGLEEQMESAEEQGGLEEQVGLEEMAAAWVEVVAAAVVELEQKELVRCLFIINIIYIVWISQF